MKATTESEGVVIFTCKTCGEIRKEAVPLIKRTEEDRTAESEKEIDNSEENSQKPQKPVSDPTADLEDSDYWNSLFEDFVLTGNWAGDLIAVAESQIGYSESTRNFEAILNKEENAYEVRGWTRYGAWYGIPYGDWCAMFISFCLFYSEITEDFFPYDCGTVTWVNSLLEDGLYSDAENYAPKPGDIVFFDWEGDELADHVGIVFEADEENDIITTIEGNHSNTVKKWEYHFTDSHILGYGVLPTNPELSDPGRTGIRASSLRAGDNVLLYMDENGVEKEQEDYVVYDGGTVESGTWYAIKGEMEVQQIRVLSGVVDFVLCCNSDR